MALPKNILVPTDFSKGAEAALDYAVALAAKLDAKVHVLHVMAAQLYGSEIGVAITASMIDEIFRAARGSLDRLVAPRTGKCAFGPPLLETGDARATIEQTALAVHADLIVMGTRGNRGVTRLLLGSVAEATARVSPCPVLLVREHMA